MSKAAASKAAPAAAKAAPAPAAAAPSAAPAPAAAASSAPAPPPPISASVCNLSASELDDVREVFDLFDFWDGRDGQIDATKVGDLMRCLSMNPTVALCTQHGGTKKFGERQYKFEQFLAIYQAISKEKDVGTFADFNEAFKTFDREGQGYISAAEMRQVLTAIGEKLNEKEMDSIMKYTDTKIDNDGNVKYEEFIKKVMAGPDSKD